MKIMDCMRARVVRVPLYPILRTWRTYSMPAKTHGHCFWLPLNQVRYVSESVLRLHLLKSAEAYLICRVSCGPSGTLGPALPWPQGRRQHLTDESSHQRKPSFMPLYPCPATVSTLSASTDLSPATLPSLLALCPWAATEWTITATADLSIAMLIPCVTLYPWWATAETIFPGLTALQLLQSCDDDGLHHVAVLAPRHL